MRWGAALLFSCFAAGCGGSTPPPAPVAASGLTASGGPPFASGDAVAYVLRDAAGKLAGRVHSRFVEADGRLQVVTRAAFGAEDGRGSLAVTRTVEWATTLRDDLSVVQAKRLSSTDGRLTLSFDGGTIDLLSDLGARQVPYAPEERAILLAPEDMVLLALVVSQRELKVGASLRLPVRAYETAEVEAWPVQVYADASRRMVLRTPLGVATLDERGRVARVERSDGLSMEAVTPPGEPPALLPPPQVARYDRSPTAGFTDREVELPVEEGVLAGTLSVPRHRAKWGERQLAPAVLLLSDLPPQNRHGFTGSADWGTWQLLDRLAEDGFVVLRLDDRGVGGSRSSLASQDVGFERLVADGRAAVELLRRQPTVDPERIFVIGHGLGSFEAARVAAEEKLRGLVLLAPPHRPLPKVLGEAPVRLRGQDPVSAERDARVALDALAGSAAAEASVPPELLSALRPHRARLAGYEALQMKAELAKVEAPVAVFQGLADFEVSWREDAKALVDAVNEKRRRHARLFVYERVDHLLKSEPNGSTPERYRDPGRRVEPKVLDDLSAWLTERAKAE